MSAPIWNAADGVELTPDDQNDADCAVVSDLVNLIERVQTSRRPIERAIAREISLNGQESSTSNMNYGLCTSGPGNGCCSATTDTSDRIQPPA